MVGGSASMFIFHRGFVALLGILVGVALPVRAAGAPAPAPMVDQAHPAKWVFVYKFNAASYPASGPVTQCVFGGDPKSYARSQRYIVSSSGMTALSNGPDMVGVSPADPIGATFARIYASGLNFVVWNDQFYSHPKITGCSNSCSGPWGHSKGILAWDDKGRGVVLQVTTPSWPGSGTSAAPRQNDGNTLGCVEDDDVKAAQHFFALQLDPADTAYVLDALANASVATDISNPQLARLGGPPALTQRAKLLGQKSPSTTIVDVVLSSGVRLIGKPSRLHVPPWQMLSAKLGGVPLRTATWWASPRIPTTVSGQTIICWRDDLGAPGAVEVATSGHWQTQAIGLTGGPQPNSNHAKIGVSIDGAHHYAIFADLNQQGRLTGNCASSQNGRGGLFFIVDDEKLQRA